MEQIYSSKYLNENFAALPQLNLDAGREAFLAYFKNGWELTELLFSGLTNEGALYRRPYHKLRHPLIFYYAHVPVVYVNKLRVAGLLDKPVRTEFETLFEIGVDEMRWDEMHEGEQDVWPPLSEVLAYREQVYTIICDVINTHPLLDATHLPIGKNSPFWALVMGFEHERIHLETSSVLVRELPIDCVAKPESWPGYNVTSCNAPDNIMITLSEQEVKLGKPFDDLTYGWDNEYGDETRHVRSFSASKQLISNGELFEFVKADGYSTEHYWSAEGWAWRCFRNVKWPCFWMQDGPVGSHLYTLRTIFEEIPMQSDWPVCVNYHEAKAYCRWRTEVENSTLPYRLLTEAEHHAIRGNIQGNNLGLKNGAETSVNAYPANDKGFHDACGNVWQWCEDHFHPLEGTESHPYYIDFSTPCYDGQHQMVLGGSFVSVGNETSPYARFHFRPHFYQHVGFRLARYKDGSPKLDAKHIHEGVAATYETKGMLNTYMLMHWGSEGEVWNGTPANAILSDVVHLPKYCADLVIKYTRAYGRALDLGCSVGRASFELAKAFQEVVGIDYSHEFIAHANALKANSQLGYQRKGSGADSTELTAKVDSAIDRSCVSFEQGDACKLSPHLKSFDAVLMANVLCRLPKPARALERMQGDDGLIKPGGILVLTTPFSWLEEFTHPSEWIDGIKEVKEILTEFELLHQDNVPFVIRDHARKFEYITTLVSVWQRKKD